MNIKMLAMLGAMCVSGALAADTSSVTRRVLQTFDVPGEVAQECIFGLAELGTDATIGRHFHHGVEAGYVLQGEMTLEIENEEPRLLKAGDSYRIPARKVHDGRNVGSVPARVNAVWVVEKGKPLSTPAD